MITRGLVLRLGLSQLVCWGISYYAIALFTLPLHLAIPTSRYRATSREGVREVAHLATTSREVVLASLLLATSVTLTTVISSAMSAQMITILGGLGLGAGVAVWTATLRGIGQWRPGSGRFSSGDASAR